MLEGRRIVVTGASSGIGRALAAAYAAHRATVWAVGRDTDRLAAVAAATGATAVPADLTTAAGLGAVTTRVAEAGALDVAVHAAGALGPVGVPLRDYPDREWREVMHTNLDAVHRLHRSLGPLLDLGHVPTVIALSSTVGRQGRAGWGMYAISKYALEGWVAVLADEWKQGRVYSVNPGGTRTPMRAEARPNEDPTTVPTPEEITPLFLRLAHPAAPESTGVLLEARHWIGRDPWEGLGADPTPTSPSP